MDSVEVRSGEDECLSVVKENNVATPVKAPRRVSNEGQVCNCLTCSKNSFHCCFCAHVIYVVIWDWSVAEKLFY